MKEKYLAKRLELLAQADVAAQAGELEKFENIKKEIETLDNTYDAQCKMIADMEALKGAQNAPIQNKVIDGQKEVVEDFYASKEYRLAFANFVATGKPMKFSNTDESTLTTDVGSVIPTTIVPRIIETMEKIGMILPTVTRTFFKTGVQIPTSSVKPTASWVNEGASSDRQKKATSYISFSRYKLRCEVSWSMEVNESTLGVFEATFTKQVAEAMVKAIETKIISNADGTTGMKGIFAETPAAGQALTAKTLTYELLASAEGALPEQYEANAVWLMSKKTFMGLVGMTDSNGNKIGAITINTNGKPERTVLGRPVLLTGAYMDSFSATLTTGKIFAALFNMEDYAVNTTYDMGITRKQDWDTEDMLTKAVMAVDGKVLDKGSLVTIAKSA